MLHTYSISQKDLRVNNDKLVEILYRDADRETRRKFAEKESFINRIDRLSSYYLHCLEPAGFTSPVVVDELRNIFYESLPADSPIYQAAEFWKTGEIFLVTIGQELENSVKNLTEKGDLTDALFLDAMGSALVEEAAEIVQKKWCERLKETDTILPDTYPIRYSPGYCNWDVKAQEILFAFLGGGNIPVSLTPGGMMHPRKSISGILVLEEADPVSPLAGSCRLCGLGCEYMREKTEYC